MFGWYLNELSCRSLDVKWKHLFISDRLLMSNYLDSLEMKEFGQARAEGFE